jgi:hypothetical protein
MPIGGGSTGGEGAQDPGFGGYSTFKGLLDAVVEWLPKLTRLFLSRYQGKYQAWTSTSTLATGAPQLPSTSTSNEEAILNAWAQLSEKQRVSILQFALAFRLGGSACTRKFNRPFAECEKTVSYNGQTYCVQYSSGAQGDVCDQASAPSSCRRVISTWRSVATCDSLPDEQADRFFSWLSNQFINQTENISQNTLTKLYLDGVPRVNNKLK